MVQEITKIKYLVIMNFWSKNVSYRIFVLKTSNIEFETLIRQTSSFWLKLFDFSGQTNFEFQEKKKNFHHWCFSKICSSFLVFENIKHVKNVKNQILGRNFQNSEFLVQKSKIENFCLKSVGHRCQTSGSRQKNIEFWVWKCKKKMLTEKF